MIQAYKKYWKGYVDFSGTTGRKDFWLALLANWIVSVMLGVISGGIGQGQPSADGSMAVVPLLTSLYSVIVFLPSLAIMVRRLRDAGQGWANLFWVFLPLAGAIILIVKLCKPSVTAAGYDPNPAQPQTGGAGGQAVFCSNCGTPMAESARFCSRCGAPRPVPAAPAQTAYEKKASEPVTPAGVCIKAKPQRAVWVAVWLIASLIALLLLHSIPGMNLLYCSSVFFLSTTALLGIGSYLLQQQGTKWKIYAVCTMLVSILLSYTGSVVLRVISNYYGRFSFRHLFKLIFVDRIRINSGWDLLTAVFVAGGALLFGRLTANKSNKERIWQSSLYTSLAVLLLNVIITVSTVCLERFFPASYKVAALVGDLITSTMLFLALPALDALCTLRTEKIRLTGWGRVWCWLCTVGMAVAIANCILSIMGYAGELFSSQLILSVAALVGFILLIAGKRVGWFIVLFSSFTVLLGQFQTSFTGAVQGATHYIPLMVGAITGASTPLITWFSIKNAWQTPDASSVAPPPINQPGPAAQPPKAPVRTSPAVQTQTVPKANASVYSSSTVTYAANMQHYTRLVDQYAHCESLFADNPEKAALEAQLLKGGDCAQAAITAYLLLCGAGKAAHGWWNGAAGLTRMLRKIAGQKAEYSLNQLKSCQTNIWEYHTQVKDTAEKELLALKKENGGFKDGLIPAEYAHAELLRLQNVSKPQDRLVEFFAMQKSAESWSNADKAFYYFIAGGAARVLYPMNKANLAFYAAQVLNDPNPTSMGWQHLREAEGSSLAATPENARRMSEKYPLPKSMEEVMAYRSVFEPNRAPSYTLESALNDLTSLFRAYPLDTQKIREIGQKINDAGLPLVNGVGGMHQLYAQFTARMPMFGTILSKIWDGVGDWAD